MGVWPWLVEHNVIRPHELARARHVDPYPQHLSAIYGIWIGVLNSEGCDRSTSAIEIFLVVGGLCERGGEEGGFISGDVVLGLFGGSGLRGSEVGED